MALTATGWLRARHTTTMAARPRSPMFCSGSRYQGALSDCDHASEIICSRPSRGLFRSMESEAQTSRRLPLTSPQNSEPPGHPGSPAPSSTGGRPNSFAVSVFAAMVPNRRPLRSTHPPKPPKILSIDKARKKYGKESPDVILKLPSDILMSLPADILDQLPPDRLGKLPDDVLQRVSPSTLAGADTSVLMRLPVQILAGLPIARLMTLDPAKLAQMDPRWLADFLREVPETIQELMSNREVLSRLLQLPPEEFIRLPYKALEMVSSETFMRMPPHIWGKVPYERLISFPKNMRVAYPIGLPGRLDPPEKQADDLGVPIATPSIRTTSLTSASTAVWPPEGAPSLPQNSLPWFSTIPPMAPLAPFMPPTSKPAPPLPPAMPDIKAEMQQSLNDIRLDDLKIERDQLKSELRTEREKLNRQLGNLEAEKNHLEASKAQLELEKRKTAEAIRHHLKDKNLGNIDRGQDEVQILIEFNKDQHRYAVDLERRAAWWEDEHNKLRSQWISLDARRQELEAKLQEAGHAHARTKQEIKDQRSVVRALDASKLEVVRLQTTLTRVEATWEARLEKRESELMEYYASQQSELNEELRLLKLEKLKWEKDIDALNAQRQSEQLALMNNHQVQIQTQRAEYSAYLHDVQQKLHEDYRAQLEESRRQQEEMHRQSTSELLERITSLESSLVDNSDDFRPATDDSLRNKYQSLKLTIDTITFNLGTVTFPRGTRLDRWGFLEREGKGEEVYLLRSIIWEKLQQGFFSLPFGLGALGPGDGKKRLLDLFVAYRRISGLEPLGLANLTEQECIKVFRTDKEVNIWRSSTFQTLGTALIPKKGKSASDPDQEQHAPYFQNREQVLNSIKAVLGEVCAGVSEDMEQKVTELVHQAGELALEFGAQRAELGFESPPQGSSVQIGRGFIDCIDDDDYRDELKTVALAVSPKFYKTGDGRHDLTSTKLIAQGTIFSARS